MGSCNCGEIWGVSRWIMGMCCCNGYSIVGYMNKMVLVVLTMEDFPPIFYVFFFGFLILVNFMVAYLNGTLFWDISCYFGII